MLSGNVTEPVLRSLIADYLNCKTTAEGDDNYCLLGVGINSLNETAGAQEYKTTYVSQTTATTYVKSYETEFPYDFDFVKSEEAIMALYKVQRDHLVGTDAMFEYVRVDLYDTSAQSSGSNKNLYPARKFVVSCVASGTEGEGGGYVKSTGTLKCVGDPVQGTFDTSTKTFTAAS